MKYASVLIASAIVFCFSSAAAAEPPIGSRLGERMVRSEEKRVEVAALGAQEMARCLVDKSSRTVRAYLSALDPADSKRLSRRMNSEHQCFNMSEGNDLVEGRMITFPEDIYRGMLSEWAVKADLASFRALPALPRQLTYSRAWYAVTGRDMSVDEMATCVSESAPGGTLALLQTTPYSKEEGAAFGVLGPNLGACLRTGVRLTGNLQSLRAALADALYQRIVNPPAPTATK